MRAGIASQNRDFEASADKLIKDGWAKVASGLRGLMSAL